MVRSENSTRGETPVIARSGTRRFRTASASRSADVPDASSASIRRMRSTSASANPASPAEGPINPSATSESTRSCETPARLASSSAASALMRLRAYSAVVRRSRLACGIARLSSAGPEPAVPGGRSARTPSFPRRAGGRDMDPTHAPARRRSGTGRGSVAPLPHRCPWRTWSHAWRRLPRAAATWLLADVLDDPDELVDPVALLAGEVDELGGAFGDRAVLRSADDADAAAAAELEQSLVAQLP